MIFGFGKKTNKVTNTQQDRHADSLEKSAKFGDKDYYGKFSSSPDAAETGGRRGDGRSPKVGNRIDKPRTKSIADVSAAGRALDDSDSEQEISVAMQMEMEKGNAIQYRTCSWQKV